MARVKELIEEPEETDEEIPKDWYILKVAVNRESTVCAALERRVKVAGLEKYFDKILVPTEEVREFTKAGKPLLSIPVHRGKVKAFYVRQIEKIVEAQGP